MKSKITVSFYHFTITPLALGLSKLIKKIYDSEKNLLVLCKNQSEISELDRTLWTFSSREFIPHGSINEPNAELQPVLLATTSDDNKNNAEVLLSTCDKVENPDSGFQKYLYGFYGNTNEVQHMIESYNTYKACQDIETIFWQQDRIGKWSNNSIKANSR